MHYTYGPFKPQGINEKTAKEIQSDPMWAEFAAKMMNPYCLIGKNESTAVSYPWITYWYTGTTSDVINTFAMKTEKDSADNLLGFKYGFLETYAGYHSK